MTHPHHRMPRHPNLPAQQPSRRTPFSPTVQADIAQFPPLQQPHEPGYGGPPPVYVVSTYDARPVNAVDFHTETGTDPRDTGWDSNNGSAIFDTSSTFYTVQPGFIGVLKNWHLLIVPYQGNDFDPANPVIAPNGASNFQITISILVNGTFQNGMTAITSWAAAFGDLFSECYVLANEGDTIEFRIDAPGASRWSQALVALYGQLLVSEGMQLQFQPATKAIIPVHETAVTPVNRPATAG